MAVAFDAVGSSVGFASATATLTWTHTAGAGGGTALVAVSWGSQNTWPPTVNTATYGGNPLTLLASQASNNGATSGGVLLWGITGQTSGSKTVTITFSAVPTDELIGNSISFTGATTFGTPAKNAGTGASASVAVAGTTAGNLVCAAECHGTNAAVTWTSGTQRWDDEVSAATGSSNSSGATLAAGGTVTPAVTITSDNFGIIAVEVMALPAAAPPSPPWPAQAYPPGWFPGADRVVTQPDGIPFAQQPQPVPDPGAVILPLPQLPPDQLPRMPPGWFPGADQVTTEPGGIPFAQQAPPADPSAGVPLVAVQVLGFPDFLPYPPNWFPGGDKLSGAPAGIPFWVQPQPDSSPALPPIPPPPPITNVGGTPGAGWFTRSDGTPAAFLCDAGWGLIASAGRWGPAWQTDMDNYLTTRANQGFTVVLTTAIGTSHSGSPDDTGNTWDGVAPFTTAYTVLNPSYWARVDYFLAKAQSLGLTVVLDVLFTYCLSTPTNILFGINTGSNPNDYGTALGNRYKNTPNLIWHFGDDYDGSSFPAVFSGVIGGIRGAGATQLASIENTSTGSTARYDLTDTSHTSPYAWGNANATHQWVYYYAQTYFSVEYAYGEPSLIPVVQGDGMYWGEVAGGTAANDQALRWMAWWAVASGSRGYSTAQVNVHRWDGSGSAAAMLDGSWFTSWAKNLRTTLEGLTGWQKLIPDTSSVLVTAGRGTRAVYNGAAGQGFVSTTDNYVAASRAPDGSLAVIYCRTTFSITIDQTRMAPGYTATWVDPASGATQAGTPGSTFNSGPLGSNSAGDADWVLVLQGTPVTTPDVGGTPDFLPFPPGWFPGADRVTNLPGGIPFYVVPQPADQVAAPAGVTTTATAALAGAGSVTAVVTQDAGTSTSLAAAGAVAAVVTEIPFAAAAGAGSVTDVVTEIAPASLTGAGAVADTPATDAVTAALAGAGSIAGVVTEAVTASLAAAGAVTAVATQIAAATLPGLPGWQPQPPGWFPGADPVTDLPGGIPFYVVPQPADQAAPPAAGLAIATASLAGAGAVTALVTEAPIATIAGAGTVADVVTEAAGASLTGAGSLTDVVTQAATSSAAGAGSVADVVTQAVTAALTGAGAVADVATQAVTAAPVGAGSVSAVAASSGNATAGLAGAGAVTAVATVIVTAAPVGAGAVTAAVTQAVKAAAAGAGTLSANGQITGTAGLAGAGAVTGKAVQAVTASPAGAGTLAALAAQAAKAQLAGAGAVTAAGSVQAAVILGYGAVLAGAAAGGSAGAGPAATGRATEGPAAGGSAG